MCRLRTDLLDGIAPEDTIDQPSVIVGRGKLGTALASMGMGEDLVLGRGEDIPLMLPYSSGKGDEGDSGEFTLVCNFRYSFFFFCILVLV